MSNFLPELFSAKILVSNSVAYIDSVSAISTMPLGNNVTTIVNLSNGIVDIYRASTQIPSGNAVYYTGLDRRYWVRGSSSASAESSIPIYRDKHELIALDYSLNATATPVVLVASYDEAPYINDGLMKYKVLSGQPNNIHAGHLKTNAGDWLQLDVSTLTLDMFGGPFSIVGATQANPGVISTEQKHGLTNGQRVKIANVLGMTSLNGQYYTITTNAAANAYTFSIGVDTSGYGAYAGGGNVITDDVAAEAAFAMNKPLHVPSGNVLMNFYPSNSTYNTPESRHLYFMDAIKWREKCIVGADSNTSLTINFAEGGLITMSAVPHKNVVSISSVTQANPAVVVTSNAHNLANATSVYIMHVSGMTEINNRQFTASVVNSSAFQLVGINSSGYTAYSSGGQVFIDENPVAYWSASAAGSLKITANSIPTDVNIASITFGTRGASDYPIERTSNQYKITIVTEAPVSNIVTTGYSLGLKNIQGTNDVEIATGGIVAESVTSNATASVIVGTLNASRAVDLVNGTIDLANTYASQLASRLVVPSVCIGWDTSYYVQNTVAITGVFRSANSTVSAITQANPCVLNTTGSHNLSNGQMVFLGPDVGGMTQIQENWYIVANTTANSFIPQTLAYVNVDSSAYSAFTSGGTVYGLTTILAPSHNLANSDIIRLASIGGTTQLNDRQVMVYKASANAVSLRTHFQTANTTFIVSTGYSAYTSGGTMQKVTEFWTGSDKEGYINITYGGTAEIKRLGFAYQGWLRGAWGTTMDQDLFHLSENGTHLYLEYPVLCGAGDMVVRHHRGAGSYINRACIGGGGSQYAIYLDLRSVSQVATSSIGNQASRAGISGPNCVLSSTSSIWAAGVNIFEAIKGGVINFTTSKGTGAVRVIYPQYGGIVYVDDSTLIQKSGTGIDGIGGGTVIGLPTFANNTANSDLIQDAFGPDGGSQWISNVVSPRILYFDAGATINYDSGTATDAGAGVTISKMAGVVTSQSLTTAPNNTATIVITNSLATASSIIHLTRVGGSNTNGIPEYWVTRSSGSFTINIRNNFASTNNFNGTFIFSFLLGAS